MKKVKYIILLLCATVASGSCSQDDYIQYDDNLASVRFVYTAAGNDSIVYSFALHPDVEEDIVEIPLQLIGLTSSLAREFGVEVVDKESTAKENVDFLIEESVLPAQALEGSLKVRVKKTLGLNGKDLTVKFHLCGNENFVAAPINESMFRIVLTNKLAEPKGWPFGNYSPIKHEFVIKVTGVATDYDRWTTADRVYWTGKLNVALYEYNKTHPDNPLKDENGMLVTF